MIPFFFVDLILAVLFVAAFHLACVLRRDALLAAARAERAEAQLKTYRRVADASILRLTEERDSAIQRNVQLVEHMRTLNKL